MSFKASLNLGQMGELMYYQAHEGTLTRTDGRKGDFTHTDGHLIELKTDTYPMAKTQNLFIERYSDREKKSPGGVWQAAENGATEFVYFYVSDLTGYSFNTQELMKRVEELAPTLQTRVIPNRTWQSEGFLVPRQAVADLGTEFKLKVVLA